MSQPQPSNTSALDDFSNELLKEIDKCLPQNGPLPPRSTRTLSDFPDELLVQMAKCLPQKDLLNLRSVSRRFRKITQEVRRLFRALVLNVQDDAYVAKLCVLQFEEFIKALPSDSFTLSHVTDIFLDCTSCRHRCRYGRECRQLPECQSYLDHNPRTISILRDLVPLFHTPVQIIERLSSNCRHRRTSQTHGSLKGLPPCGDHRADMHDCLEWNLHSHVCVRPWIGLNARDLEVAFLATEPSLIKNKQCGKGTSKYAGISTDSPSATQIAAHSMEDPQWHPDFLKGLFQCQKHPLVEPALSLAVCWIGDDGLSHSMPITETALLSAESIASFDGNKHLMYRFRDWMYRVYFM
ncbi:hypothetical protein HDV00_009102 [Rhizophlyctis rosea]|nr:hypothetical protein HDV00_009102 [Rhizophlyctis rosea]